MCCGMVENIFYPYRQNTFHIYSFFFNLYFPFIFFVISMPFLRVEYVVDNFNGSIVNLFRPIIF
jgi:hypothetical protein